MNRGKTRHIIKIILHGLNGWLIEFFGASFFPVDIQSSLWNKPSNMDKTKMDRKIEIQNKEKNILR